MPRIPNWKIDAEVKALNEFVNYNGTIVAVRSGVEYIVVHWNTTILRYNLETKTISFLLEDYRSQTTSTLVGRLVRGLPRESVMSYITGVGDNSNRQRLRRMLGRIYTPEIY
jgi:hypothetical protein